MYLKLICKRSADVIILKKRKEKKSTIKKMFYFNNIINRIVQLKLVHHDKRFGTLFISMILRKCVCGGGGGGEYI